MAWLMTTGDGRSYERQMTCTQLYERLGLDPKKHLPDEGVYETDVDGVTVYILSKEELQLLQGEHKRLGRKCALPMKRTFAFCPVCRQGIEAGHLHQHRKYNHKGV